VQSFGDGQGGGERVGTCGNINGAGGGRETDGGRQVAVGGAGYRGEIQRGCGAGHSRCADLLCKIDGGHAGHRQT